MKKVFLAGAMLGAFNFAQATTINAPSGLIGKNAMSASYAYLWSVPAAAQNITSATITFTGVVRTGSGKGNDISVDIGNFLSMPAGQSSVPTSGGLSDIKDKKLTKTEAGDAFNANVTANDAIHLGTQLFASKKTAQTWSYTFTGAQLEALNNYIANGNWGFEIDADGRFTVGGITLNYTTAIADTKPAGTVATVPDLMTTFGLLAANFLGLVVVRRKFCFN
jgi:hypothetical protein